MESPPKFTWCIVWVLVLSDPLNSLSSGDMESRGVLRSDTTWTWYSAAKLPGPVKSATTSWGYEDSPLKGHRPPLLVAADLLFWRAKKILYLGPQTFLFLFACAFLLFIFTRLHRGLGCALTCNFKGFSTWVFLAG
jgi:hypothetical protein